MSDTATAERNAYSLPEFCERNGVSLTKAYELARAGRLDVRKLGGKTVVTAEAEREFIKNLPKWKPAAPTNHRRANMQKLNEARRARRAAAGAA